MCKCSRDRLFSLSLLSLYQLCLYSAAIERGDAPLLSPRQLGPGKYFYKFFCKFGWLLELVRRLGPRGSDGVHIQTKVPHRGCVARGVEWLWLCVWSENQRDVATKHGAHQGHPGSQRAEHGGHWGWREARHQGEHRQHEHGATWGETARPVSRLGGEPPLGFP